MVDLNHIVNVLINIFHFNIQKINVLYLIQYEV